jgi:hypothetical protein
MLKLEDLPAEDRQEVVRLAARMADEETATADEARATRDAAEEMGIPAQYLDRAAAEVHARRVERIKQSRRRRNGILAAVGAVLVLGVGWRLLNPPRPAPLAVTATAAAPLWTLDANPETRATLAASGEAQTLTVERFAKNSNGTFFANLNTRDAARDLAGYRTARFKTRGTGLPNVRLYLENGAERWRSPALPVTSTWSEQAVPLNQFERQTRAANGQWRRVNYKAPGDVQRLSFKTGDFVNDISAKGEVSVDAVRFE